MKMVTAVIRPENCQAVKDALKEIDVNGMTITHVYGRGRQAGLKFTTRAGVVIIDELEKTKIEIVVDDAIVQKVVDTICKAACTGHHGDGKIFISPVEASYTISEYISKNSETQNQ